MYNLICSEFYKLIKLKTIKILFTVSCLSAAAMTVISHEAAMGKAGGNLINVGSLLTDFQMMGLFGSVLAAIFICEDFENKTIQNAAACGFGRAGIIAAKALVYFGVIFFLLLPYGAAAGIALASGNRFAAFLPSVFQQIMAQGHSLELTAATLSKMAVLVMIAAIVYAGQLSVNILLAFSIKKAVPVLALGYGINALLAQLNFIPAFQRVLSYTPFGMDFTAFTIEALPGVFIKAAVISILFIILILAATVKIFRTSELK